LETFIYDPLVEWQTQRSNTSNVLKPRPESGEVQAKVHLKNIDLRLRGSVKPTAQAKEYGLPLNVEGRVNVLIEQATDIRLLAQMYYGWGSYV